MDLQYLATLTDLEYEAERCRLIGEAIDGAPSTEIRKAALILQYEIDARRDRMPADEFMNSLVSDMREMIYNMDDQLQYALNTAKSAL